MFTVMFECTAELSITEWLSICCEQPRHTFGLRSLLYTTCGEDVGLIVGPPTVHSGSAMAWIHRHRPEVGQYPGCRWDTTSVNGYYWEQRVIQCV